MRVTAKVFPTSKHVVRQGDKVEFLIRMDENLDYLCNLHIPKDVKMIAMVYVDGDGTWHSPDHYHFTFSYENDVERSYRVIASGKYDDYLSVIYAFLDAGWVDELSKAGDAVHFYRVVRNAQ